MTQAEWGLKAARRSPGWPRAALALAALGMVVAALYWETYASMVKIWERSETFAHGYLILPISLFLIWRKRDELARTAPRPNLLGLGLLAGAGVAWLIARVAGVQVVEQLAAVALIPSAVLTVLGWQVAWTLAFPLVFLFFAVPMGEDLIPPLVDFTATFTVTALQFSGIPVFREGTFFSIPSGDWSVVEACSGLRYLIAAVTLGCLYAYLTYRSFYRRAIFVVLSIIVPVVANGLRAYMIVMIAHFSDMKLAMGVDHYIYGWAFFGIVMALLFWIGAGWREDQDGTNTSSRLAFATPAAPRAGVVAGVLALAVVASWPALAALAAARVPAGRAVVELALPAVAGAWRAQEEPLTTWQPRYIGAEGALDRVYTDGNSQVQVVLRYYGSQRQDEELINSQNVLAVEKDPYWRRIGKGERALSLPGDSVTVRQAQMQTSGQQLLVWYWYWLDGHMTADDYEAKLWLAWRRLSGRPADAALVLVAAPYDHQPQAAEPVLTRFVAEMASRIDAALAGAR